MTATACVICAAITLGQPATTQPTPTPPAQPETPSATRFLEVPLKGTFGQEITAPGIRDAIRAAKSKKAAAVVFTFDTPGGRVLDADAIASVMDAERAAPGGADLKYYALITQAFSASVWPLSRCDRIFFAPGAAAGAAVAFKQSANTGNIEVDAKFNAAMAASVSAAAESHGQSGAAYRAMMLKDARLFGFRDASGDYHLADQQPPADAKDIEEIDTAATVLAWTTEQAAKYHYGIIAPSADPAALGALLGADSWQGLGDLGSSSMTRWFKEIERKVKDTEKAETKIKEARDHVIEIAKRIIDQDGVAEKAEPDKGGMTIYYKEGSGVFTGDTQVRWRTQTDTAIREWNIFLTLISDLEKAERLASGAVDDYNKARDREFQARLWSDKPEPVKLDPVKHNLDLKALRKHANDAISRLNANRGKTRL